MPFPHSSPAENVVTHLRLGDEDAKWKSREQDGKDYTPALLTPKQWSKREGLLKAMIKMNLVEYEP